MHACLICAEHTPLHARRIDQQYFCTTCKKSEVFLTDFACVKIHKMMRALPDTIQKDVIANKPIFQNGNAYFCYASDLNALVEAIDRARVQFEIDSLHRHRKMLKQLNLCKAVLAFHGIPCGNAKFAFGSIETRDSPESIVYMFLGLLGTHTYREIAGKYFHFLPKTSLNPITVTSIITSLLGSRALVANALNAIRAYKTHATEPMQALFNSPVINTLRLQVPASLHTLDEQAMVDAYLHAISGGASGCYPFLDYKTTKLPMVKRFGQAGRRSCMMLMWVVYRRNVPKHVVELVASYF